MFNKLKDDTTNIPDLEGVLKGKIKGKITKHEVRPLTQFGDNFGSEILRMEITVDENGEENVVHAVAKLIPPTEMQMEIFNTQVTFKNEIGFYAEIVPTLQEFQREHGIEPIADYFPEFYGARTSLKPSSTVVDNDAVIIMENLKISGYDTIDRQKGFDLESSKTVLRTLANFQATTLALRKKNPQVFNSRVNPYLSEWKAPGFPLNIDDVVKENPKTVPLLPKVQSLLWEGRVKKIREPWATITHNDLWVNNIMVKESNGEIASLKLIDFQMPDYGSPATDLLFFLLSSVQTPVLQYHLERLLQYYYKEFIQVLQSFKIDTREFTYESFQEELKHEARYQTIHSLGMLFVILGPKGLTKMPGKAPQWNPNNQADVSNGHAGPPPGGFQNGVPPKHGPPPPHGGPPPQGPPSPHGPPPKDGSKPPEGPQPPLAVSAPMKEKIWFIVEEAAKRKWI